MKKVFLSLMAMTVMGFSAMAQTDKGLAKKEKTELKGHRGKHQEMAGKFKELNLTAAQQQEMKSLNEDYKKKMLELKNNDAITVKEQRERREALAKEHRANVEKLLTAEQKAKLTEAKPHKGGKAHKVKGGRKDLAGSELNLSADQQVKMKTLNESMRTRARSIQQDQALTKEQKKTQLQTLRSQHKQEVSGILTSEQKEKMESLKDDRKAKAL
ncbi:hypothetical protein EXU57_12545 [Segetibacter sp. 3557_3]|uniref:hypothetical protein n=1 Tax=Segetibacter sp. 3557_3 TaxID=2547429 RepID=UPI001058A868|nr:hypothetical protein [Segetibacter sp. 3557_3]TDH25531.1 hypothetical protein EXU57_12545 [Segetibacter sp. 3557_3]